jgi:uncharacterized protein (DUF433 family)
MSSTVALVEKQHAAVTPGVCGVRPRIAGTRVRVQDIVLRTEAGLSPDEVLAALPDLTLADIHAALAYYHDNRDAIDEQIRESDAMVAALKAP